jgi:predicted nucleic acid-binding protein
VIYLDSSVVMAHLLGEDRAPPKSLWQEQLTASRLLEYEIWNRLHARAFGRSHGDAARALLDRVGLIELSPPVLERALEPFPLPVRTLEGLHLASIEFLRARRLPVELATYDNRMAAAADALGIPIAAL